MRLAITLLFIGLTACSTELAPAEYAPPHDDYGDIVGACGFEGEQDVEECWMGCSDADLADARDLAVEACDLGDGPPDSWEAPIEGRSPYAIGYRHCWAAEALRVWVEECG